MRSLSSLVRSVLLREGTSGPPLDPAEGELNVDPRQIDGFNQIHPETRKYLQSRFRDFTDPAWPGMKMKGVLSILPAGDRSQVERDEAEVGDGWLDRYMDRLTGRPLTGEEERLLTHDNSLSDMLLDAYNRRVSWCLLTEGLISGLESSLQRMGCSRIVEVGAGRGSLARIMRKRGYSWQAFDATSVSSPGVVRESAARVCSSLRVGDCDAILVSWVHHEADWDTQLLDASVRLGVPLVSITIPPDAEGDFRVERAGGRLSLTHSPAFWSRVERECSVTSIPAGRQDEIMVITGGDTSHPLPETSYHTSSADSQIRRVGYTIEDASRRDPDLIFALPWLLGVEEQGTDYDDATVESGKKIIRMAEQATQTQHRDARGRGSPLMPPSKVWLLGVLPKVVHAKDVELKLVDPPRNGVWVSWEDS